MRKRPELPPELADAIELTAEFREAMGLSDTIDGRVEVITEVPPDEELAQIPEWYAVNSLITADEYLATFGIAGEPFKSIPHGLRGRLKK